MEPKIEITNLIEPILKAYTRIEDEWYDLSKIGLQNYIESCFEKYYYTNTFLYRHEKVNFLEIYYPVKAKNNELITTFKNLKPIIEEYKWITITGTAGTGKSTLAKYILLNALNNNIKIPLLIELRHLNRYKGDLKTYILKKVLNYKIKPSNPILNKALRNGKFLFILDGYDEIFSKKRADINEELEDFMDRYKKNYFILTSRPETGVERLPRFNEFKICNFEKIDVINFINRTPQTIERKNGILKLINSSKSEDYIHYLKNPLLLSMFILSYEVHPEIPKRKSAFYRNVFDTLYSRHDGITKNSFLREKLSKLERDDFDRILQLLSYITYFQGLFSFTEEKLIEVLDKIKSNIDLKFNPFHLIQDLSINLSVIIKDGLEYKFPHRSFQEYFAAKFIKNLSNKKKRIAYSNFTKKAFINSNDTGFNFWEICTEIDKNSFYEYFVIPQLEIFIAEFKEKKFRELYEYLVKYLNADIFLHKKDKKISVSYTRNETFQLIEFLSIGSLIDLLVVTFIEFNSLTPEDQEKLYDKFYNSKLAKKEKNGVAINKPYYSFLRKREG